jgi:tetratricopeptide (TPR) repeat protein
MLIDASDQAITRMPPEALELGKLATEIAAELDDPVLYASALREYGYSLYFTGQLRDALAVTDHAGRVLSADALAERDLARIDLQRALILSDLGRHGDACEKARRARDIFERHGDRERVVVALRTEAFALIRMRRHGEALEILLGATERCDERVARAGLFQNIAVTYRELGDFDNAAKFFTTALNLALEIGSAPFVTKARWHLGRLFLAQGKCREALDVLFSVRESFLEMQMSQDVAVATIDIAQALLILEEPQQVVALCREASEYFVNAGLTTSESSLTALALLREAAACNKLTPDVLARARRQAESRPHYLFAAPTK